MSRNKNYSIFTSVMPMTQLMRSHIAKWGWIRFILLMALQTMEPIIIDSHSIYLVEHLSLSNSLRIFGIPKIISREDSYQIWSKKMSQFPVYDVNSYPLTNMSSGECMFSDP